MTKLEKVFLLLVVAPMFAIITMVGFAAYVCDPDTEFFNYLIWSSAAAFCVMLFNLFVLTIYALYLFVKEDSDLRKIEAVS